MYLKNQYTLELVLLFFSIPGPRAKETKIKNKKYIDKKEKNKDINPQTEKKRK